MREKTCCFTGHRNIVKTEYRKIEYRLEQTIISLIHSGVCYFGTGGAIGFDTIAAKIILRLRKQYPQIKLILVLPCLSQTKGWTEENIKIYEEIKSEANKVIYTSQEYTRECTRETVI